MKNIAYFLLLFPFFSSFGQKNIIDSYDYLKFIENKGQWKDDFLFKSSLPGGNLFLQKNHLTYSFYDAKTRGQLMADLHDHKEKDSTQTNEINYHAFSVNFLNANPTPIVKGTSPYTENRNYFLGNTQASNVQAFQKVIYENIFNQVDFHIFQSGKSIKYEFYVAPHSNPYNIQLQYNNVEALFIQNEELHIKTSLNEIIEEKPYAYQIIRGEKKEIKCQFVLTNNILSYQLGHYNRNYPLVIDPKLIFSTYSGSTTDNWGNTACLDKTGNLYTGGTVFGDVLDGFPTTLGAYKRTFQGGDADIGILKFDSSGTKLLYATYIGGNDSEIPTSLITNENQELYILAMTGSSDFPTSTNAFQKEFKGALSKGKWLVNGKVITTTHGFNSSTLKEGDKVQFVISHNFCGTPQNQLDSSNVITIQQKKLRATLQSSHQNFCTGDSIAFLVNDNSKNPSYEWFVNGILEGSDTNFFYSKTLNDNDIIQCKVTDTFCNLSTFSNEWKVSEMSGKTLTPIITAPKIVCSNGRYDFSLNPQEIGTNASVIWKNKNDTIGIFFSLNHVTAKNDSIYAIIQSNLTCLQDTSLFTDTIFVKNDIILTPKITLLPTRTSKCVGDISLTATTENLGVGTTYSWFVNDKLSRITNSPFLYLSSSVQAGEYKVVTNSTLGCVSNPIVKDSIIVNFSSFLQISANEDSICLGEKVDFSSNFPLSLYNIASSIIPVGGYSFEKGTDISILKLSKDGSKILASTLIGGGGNDGILDKLSDLNNNYGDILRGDINIDKDGNIYVASTTQSIDFPIVNGAQKSYGGGNSDGIAFKLNADFSQLLWSTYLGGKNDDALYSIQRDSLNNVYVAGGSMSDDFPITNKAYQQQRKGNVDAVITKINPTGNTFLNSTYFGTAEYDQSYFIQIDSDNEVYILGQTKGNMPILPNSSIYHQKNAGLFVTKFKNELDSIIFSTTLGDTNSTDAIIPNISPTAFLVNECENIFIAGWGGETNHNKKIGDIRYNGGYTWDMPLSENAFQKTSDGSDFYMMVIRKDLEKLLYATYFGGPISEEHVDGGTSRFDEKGIVYQSVCAGCGGNNDFPIYPPFDNDPNTYPKPNLFSNCNNGVIKFDLALLEAKLSTKIKCNNQLEIENLSIGGIDFQWDFGDGKTLITANANNFIHQYDSAGTYTIQLIARDITTCRAYDTVSTITVVPSQIGQRQKNILCLGDSISLKVTEKPNATYSWFPSTYLKSDTLNNQTILPLKNIIYLVSIIDTNQCKQVDTISINVHNIKPKVEHSILGSCVEFPKVAFKSNVVEKATFLWDFGNGVTSQEKNPTFLYDTYGKYKIKLAVTNGTCTFVDSTNLTLDPLYVPNIITPNQDGKNEELIISGIQNNGDWNLEIYNRWGKEVFRHEYYDNSWKGDYLEDGTYYYLLTAPDKTTCKGWLQITR